MSDELEQRVVAYLQEHNTMTLATTGAGMPWAATVFYVNLGLNLYFLSESTTRHGQNMAASTRVAAAVQEDYADWRQIKGIQLEGEARVVASAWVRNRVLAAFIKKFSSVASLLATTQFGRVLARANLYHLVPLRVYFLDNARGFSHREELFLGQDNEDQGGENGEQQ